MESIIIKKRKMTMEIKLISTFSIENRIIINIKEIVKIIFDTNKFLLLFKYK